MNSPCGAPILWGISPDFSGLSPCYRWIAYVLLTRAPVAGKGIATSPLPLDLHVLGLSLAFILSQDQTLRCNIYSFYIFLLHVKVVHPCPGVRLSCFYLDVDLFPLRFPEKGPSLSTIISVYRNTFNELLSFLAPLEARKFCKDKNFFTPVPNFSKVFFQLFLKLHCCVFLCRYLLISSLARKAVQR